jgi:MoaA/NifB/PqqE/SkfB family radical SAM enzyme
MKIYDINHLLQQALEVGYIQRVYFEGGEPFLYFPTMLWGLRKAKKHGFETGIVTNAYWATSIQDAIEWLTPISNIGISDLSISDDLYHYGEHEENLARYAYDAAKELNLPVGQITIDDPRERLKDIEWKGKPIVKGKVLLKGRAVEKLTEGLPMKPWRRFDKCLHEDFSNQSRVHIDPFGYVHVCQGITIGNTKQTSLVELFDNFVPENHPICGPILRGGPADLVKTYRVEHREKYVDECHLCYSTRLKLRQEFPAILAPDQVYGS